MTKFRNKGGIKALDVEAVQWTNDRRGVDLNAIWRMKDSLGDDCPSPVIFAADGTPALLVRTPKGDMRAEVGDWIVKNAVGQFFPLKPDIFEATYEPLRRECLRHGSFTGSVCGPCADESDACVPEW